MLRKLLKEPSINNYLSDLTQIALNSARLARRSDRFEPLTAVMNDGFEINLGKVDYRLVEKNKRELVNILTIKSEGLTIKNALTKRKANNDLALWITLGDNSKVLGQELLKKMLKLQEVMKKHAEVYWAGSV